MIDERHEELAALYALDQLEGPARTQFEAALARDPALQSLVRDLRESAASLAHTATTKPPPILKARVLASIPTSSAPVSDHSTHSSSVGFRTVFPWALAACFALVAAWLGTRLLTERTEATRFRQQHALADVALQSAKQQLEAERIVTRRQFQDLDQQLAAANTALAQARAQIEAATGELSTAKSQLASTNTQSTERSRRLAEAEKQLATARTQLAERERQVSRLNQRIEALTHATSDLTRERDAATARVAKLSEELKLQVDLADFKIALLASLAKDNPNARAVAVWDPRKQQGVLKVAGLLPVPADRDLQLWVVDPAYPNPVDGGTFTVDPKSGEHTLAFKPRQPVTAVQAFAITRERKGGVAKAEGPMLLMGK